MTAPTDRSADPPVEFSGRALLDVNVLIAVHDEQHVHHEAAANWLVEHRAAGWATCPLTQNGCARIMSQPGYSNPVPLRTVIEMLANSSAGSSHQFWPDDVSLLDASQFAHDRLHGHRQVTDAYLLGLAVRNGGRFVTFDTGVPLSSVARAQPRHLVQI